MAKKKKKEKENRISAVFEDLREDTRAGIWGVLLFVVAIFLVLSALGYAGIAGNASYDGLTYLFGIGYFLLPFLALLIALSFFRAFDNPFTTLKAITAAIFLFSGLGLIEMIIPERGGLVGSLVASPLVSYFDFFGGILILVALTTISLLITFDVRPTFGIETLHHLFGKREDESLGDDVSIGGMTEEEDGDEEEEDEEDYEEEEDEEETEEEESAGFFGIGKKKAVGLSASLNPYEPPPLSLLEKDKGKPGVGDIKANANIIKRTLQNFGIQVEVDEISIGPTVTRYALKPAEGVRLSKIIALQHNMELALAAYPVRIEAPIPGKSLVGIEVPNTSKTTLGLASLFSSPQYKESDKTLLAALGKDITGQAHFADLAKMPHLLIAGATGSGKSVMIHDLVMSLLYRASPEQLRFVMVDPKRVELTLYNNIPHLLSPVITDAKKAILALKWLANEMDRRYDVLETEQVRDISSYHNTILAPALEKAKKSPDEEAELPEAMPYIVLIVDELADIMQAYPRELEAGIVRLAQMSRAVGIHLILSTQRPSVQVITGLIKANIPARIALQVASQIDSRTILDMGGAEKLLGAGDMLYLSSDMGKPRRIQAPHLSENEVKSVVKYLKKSYEDEVPDEIDFAEAKNIGSLVSESLEDDDDDLYDDARHVVMEAGKASTSYIQRKLRVGYARAARLMDMLEERGVIGPADGSKPREVLIGGDSDLDSDSEEEYNEGTQS
ncbi:cell division protein FtsK [Candidatus Kaiserbacteria bacterium CG10_big_fil_rev_8_21_14_0_10_49_17]|uniref:Cell division protein FtsK n=1 Tax=Candidatus Kaiserbacteria bacterium CG10_big_fil_rev_8_21_14_0_10_49_17 TaxID=1974609 RepID=A0A2M6WDS4_9BACT|nr:MAG: cell division protein FtsK [Candidatus Kaiserbacteria bacterium CG10_big_fil_rev_8_21_14_0_10_49_17]